MVGGIADYIHNLCLELQHKLTLSVYSSVPASREFDASLPYRMHRISETRRLGLRFGDGFSPLRKWNTLCWYQTRPYQARQLLTKIKVDRAPDLVVFGRWEERSHFWCRACRVGQMRYSIIAHGMELLEQKSKKWQRKRKADYLGAQLVFANSEATAQIIKQFGVPHTKISILHPGIRPENLQPHTPETLKHILSQLDLVEDQYILTLARLIPRKGIDLLIRAFAEIAGDFPDPVLIVAGDGPDASALRALAAGLAVSHRVRFLGTVSHEAKRALLQGCKFFVMPNRPVTGDMEGFGIVFLEAAMLGKAVIGGNNGGVPDAVIDGENGLLVDTSASHQPLAQTIQRLLVDTELRDRLGKNGRERVERDFSWTVLGLKMVTKFRKLVFDNAAMSHKTSLS
jgi:glycosyltransferase involved in cell wall biosynthesis